MHVVCIINCLYNIYTCINNFFCIVVISLPCLVQFFPVNFYLKHPTMPPKVRKDCEASVTSDVSISNESSTSTVTISTDALEHILSANTQTLSDILSKLPGMLSHTATESTTPVLVAPVSKSVKVPVWSDDQQPCRTSPSMRMPWYAMVRTNLDGPTSYQCTSQGN